MGLYDAVDRGGAGRKKERTLRRPLLIAAAILVAVIALIAWSCRYFFQYRSWVSDLTEATRYARRMRRRISPLTTAAGWCWTFGKCPWKTRPTAGRKGRSSASRGLMEKRMATIPTRSRSP